MTLDLLSMCLARLELLCAPATGKLQACMLAEATHKEGQRLELRRAPVSSWALKQAPPWQHIIQGEFVLTRVVRQERGEDSSQKARGPVLDFLHHDGLKGVHAKQSSPAWASWIATTTLYENARSFRPDKQRQCFQAAPLNWGDADWFITLANVTPKL